MKRAKDGESSTNKAKPPASEDDANILEAPLTKRQRTDSSSTLGLDEVAEAGDALGQASMKGSARAAPRQRAGGQSKSGGGRMRLPEKLLKYLNEEPVPDVVWWMPDGNGFAYNVERVQTEFLDKHFRGTKLTSFVRSLNRW